MPSDERSECLGGFAGLLYGFCLYCKGVLLQFSQGFHTVFKGFHGVFTGFHVLFSAFSAFSRVLTGFPGVSRGLPRLETSEASLGIYTFCFTLFLFMFCFSRALTKHFFA